MDRLSLSSSLLPTLLIILVLLATWLYAPSPVITGTKLLFRQHITRLLPYRRKKPDLPPELLTAIFAHLQRIDPPKTKKIRSKRKLRWEIRSRYREEFCDLGWLKVLHVCKRWREIAEKTPLLWNDIPNGRLPSIWVQKHLDCSRDMELSVEINMSHYPFAIATLLIQSLVMSMHRTRSLNIDASVAPSILLPQLPMTSLESLTIYGGAGSDWENPLVPHGLFDSTAPPLLKTLRLRRCLMSLEGDWIKNLVSLDVELASCTLILGIFSKSVWNLSSVALLLNRLEHLETLRIIHAFPGVMFGQPLAYHEICLPPCFKKLSMRGTLEAAEPFLSCLRLPEDASVDIDVELRPFGFSTALHPVLLRSPNAPALLSLEFASRNWVVPQLVLRTWDHTPHSITDRTTAHTKLGVHSSAIVDHTPMASVISDIEGCHEALHLKQLGEILLQIHAYNFDQDMSTKVWKDFDWAPLFARTPALRTVYARGQPAAMSALKSLVPCPKSDNCGRTLLCPVLDKIVILDVDFISTMSENIRSLIPKSRGCHIASLFDALYACLEARKKMGSPVRVVELSAGREELPKDGKAPWLVRLRELVSEVRIVKQQDVWRSMGKPEGYWGMDTDYDEYLSLP